MSKFGKWVFEFACRKCGHIGCVKIRLSGHLGDRVCVWEALSGFDRCYWFILEWWVNIFFFYFPGI